MAAEDEAMATNGQVSNGSDDEKAMAGLRENQEDAIDDPDAHMSADEKAAIVGIMPPHTNTIC